MSRPDHDPIPLALPVIGAREEELVIETLRSRRLSLGRRVKDFERGLAEAIGVEHVSAVSSGTAGLHLALRAAGVGPGDRVLTSPFSFVASANSILYEGAEPVFCDIDPRTLNLDPAAVEAELARGPADVKAILPIHIFGYPADMPAFERIASEHGLALVEDACEALGSSHSDGKAVGARGNLAVFGFYPNKQLTTGEGGAVVARDADEKARIDSERNQGRAPDMSWLDHDRLGFNYRLSDVACALGIAQLERLDEMLAARDRVAALYDEALAGIEGAEPLCPDADGDRRSWFVYVVKLRHGADRDGTIEALRERGIASKPYLPAIHLMSWYRERFGYEEGAFPVAEDAAARSIALPFFPDLEERQVERVVSALGAAI